jgi:predicted N-acetyltransferase YhbS
MTADYDKAVRHHCFDLFCRAGQIIALIETVAEAGRLLIKNIAVSPFHQGQGLGGRLIKRAEQRAASSDLSEIRLYTNKLFFENLQF